MELMARYPDGYFDLAIVDPPYGTMHCAWDDATDLEKWLAGIYRVLKPDGTLICFGQQPMFSRVVTFMGKRFSHEVIWDKITPRGFLNANRMPMKQHENIAISKVEKAVWYIGERQVYKDKTSHSKQSSGRKSGIVKAALYGQHIADGISKEKPACVRYSTSIANISNWRPAGNGHEHLKKEHDFLHPTQKPVALYQWLLKHYARHNAKVLDCFLGSGSIAIACHDYKFDLVACELDTDYYNAAMKRINQHTAQLQFDF
jgi:site-specific DNA-methyltransferase (adenine-specific)